MESKPIIIIEAEKIYSMWNQSGPMALHTLLMDEYDIPAEDAARIVEAYKPTAPPVERFEPSSLFRIKDGRRIFKKKEVKDVFRKLSLTLDGNIIWPRRLLAYYVVKKILGQSVFDFKVTDEKDKCIEFITQPIDEKGDPLKLELVALDLVEINHGTSEIARKASTLRQQLEKDVSNDLAKTLQEAGIIFPKGKAAKQLSASIKRGLKGEEVVLIGAFCPDYAYEETGDEQIPYRYTFTDLNGGVGLVAQQFVRVIPLLVRFMEKHGIKYKIRLGIADFEANSEENLCRVNKTKEEFISLCGKSLEAFQKMLPDIDMELCLLERGWLNGRWNSSVKEARDMMLGGCFGNIETITGKSPVKDIISEIADAGRKFYCEWHGREMGYDEIKKIVIIQGAEYAALGKVIREEYDNQPVIQISGDRPLMQNFNYVYSDHPTLSCKRIY